MPPIYRTEMKFNLYFNDERDDYKPYFFLFFLLQVPGPLVTDATILRRTRTSAREVRFLIIIYTLYYGQHNRYNWIKKKKKTYARTNVHAVTGEILYV